MSLPTEEDLSQANQKILDLESALLDIFIPFVRNNDYERYQTEIDAVVRVLNLCPTCQSKMTFDDGGWFCNHSCCGDNIDQIRF